MRGILKRRPSAALVISLVALFVALGGSAWAVHVKLGKNDVKAKNIKKNAVTTKKIKNDAVTADKVNDNTLTRGFASVLANGSIQAASGVVVNVSRPATGVYCFDLSDTVSGGLVTLESTSSGNKADGQASTVTNPPCAAPFTDFRVDTHAGGGAPQDDGFYIALY
jgi:hypothetical protein